MYPDPKLGTVLLLQKQLRRIRETFGELFGGEVGEKLREVAGHYQNCKPRLTETEVKKKRLGPLETMIQATTNDALEELLSMCGGMRAVLMRLERPEVPGEGVGEWEREQ